MKPININLLYSVFAGDDCFVCDDNKPFQTPPVYLLGETRVFSSGLSGWYMVHCKDVAGFDINVEQSWRDLVISGSLRMRLNGCRIKGNKPFTEIAASKRGACAQESIISLTDTVTIQDVENDDDFSVDDLYCFINKYGKDYYFGFIFCNGVVTEPQRVFSVVASIIESDTNDDDSIWQTQFKFKRSKDDCINRHSINFLCTIKDIELCIECDYYMDYYSTLLPSVPNLSFHFYSFVVDGVEYVPVPFDSPLLPTNVITLGGGDYVTNLPDALNAIGTPLTISYSETEIGGQKRFFKVKAPAGTTFEIIIGNPTNPIYRYTENGVFQNFTTPTVWADMFVYPTSSYINEPINCETTEIV